MNNLKTNLDSIIVELCQVSSDHDAQVSYLEDQLDRESCEREEMQLQVEKLTAKLEDLQGWVNVERALRVEATERIRQLTYENKKLAEENKWLESHLEASRDLYKKLLEENG